MTINLSNWKKFKIGNLIDEKKIYKSKAYVKDEMQIVEFYNENSIPFVSRTELNNSVDCFVNKDGLESIEKGNALVIGDTTATVSYQEKDFVTGDHIVIIRAEWLNKLTGLFICSLLRREKYRYSYGRAYIINSIKNTDILLPVLCDVDGIPIIDQEKKYSIDGFVPDFKYMENFIISNNCKVLKTKNDFKYNIHLNTTKWKNFEVGKLFPKVKVKKLSSVPESYGMCKFISSTSSNNGVASMVSEKTIKGNCITVSTNGDCFDAFYQEDPIVISSDVEVLYSDFLNQKIGIFICTILKLEKYKWSYGRKPKDDKVFNTIIKLPVLQNELGVPVIDNNKKYSDEGFIPDFKYMEKYISELPYGELL